MPIENLNLQIAIPKINDVEFNYNASRHIYEHTKETGLILNVNEMNNSFKKVHSSSNVDKSNIINTNINGREKSKNHYKNKKESNSVKCDDILLKGIGTFINIKI